MRIGTNPSRRRAFTLNELVLATAVTALTATASATMMFAVGNAALKTEGTRESKMQGQFVIDRIARHIRSARAVGGVEPTGFALWVEDKNDDDKANTDEIVVIEYETDNQRIVYIEPADNMPADLASNEITGATLSDITLVKNALVGPNRKTTVMANNATDFGAYGYPGNTETRLVHVKATLTALDGNTNTFQVAASPRASGDYLFVDEANEPSADAGGRKLRQVFSRWTGFADIINVGN